MTTGKQPVRMIPVDRITVVNPRARGRAKFKQIVSNISNIGLKKPITVAQRPSRNGEPLYDLVCGQGRLEAYRALGESEVPAFVIDATKEELMLMSLAENLARRSHSSAELMREIAALRTRGSTYAEIARKTDLHVQYIKGIIRLINKGEERLVRAVERGHIPITIAVTIASADEAEVQAALRDAYEKSHLRGKELLRVRRLIQERQTRGRRIHSGRTRPKVDAGKLMQAYQAELARQRLLVKKAKISETRLLFIVSSMRKLCHDEAFVNLLRAEGLDEMPQYLAETIRGAEPSA